MINFFGLTLEATTTHLHVLDVTRPRNPTLTFHTQSKCSIFHACVVAYNVKLRRKSPSLYKSIVPCTRSWRKWWSQSRLTIPPDATCNINTDYQFVFSIKSWNEYEHRLSILDQQKITEWIWTKPINSWSTENYGPNINTAYQFMISGKSRTEYKHSLSIPDPQNITN